MESKARATVDKADIAVFQLKCFDFYRAEAARYPREIAKANWWPLLVSSEPIGDAERRVCCDLGVVACDPKRVPFPALLYAASRPNADDYLPASLLGELVRLGEIASVSCQQRWRLDIDRAEIRLSLNRLNSTEIEDLLFLQDELTEDFLDAFEVYQPEELQRRASSFVGRYEAAKMGL